MNNVGSRKNLFESRSNLARFADFRNVAAFTLVCAAATAGAFSMAPAATADTDAQHSEAAPSRSGSASSRSGAPRATHVRLDRSGRKQIGKASFYAAHYSGKTMADGTPMRLYSNNAASLTLPLGTTAKVTNLETGKSAIVTIRDRGPYVKGRIVDLSPVTARKIGIDRIKGVATVEVLPIAVPLPDGTLRVASLAR